MNKQQLRQQFLAVRNGLDHEKRRQWSQTVCGLLYEIPALKQAQSVAAYFPLGSEVDLRPLLETWEREGKRLALPISYQNGKMVFHKAALSSLERGLYGILQPPEDSPVMLPEELDGILVPGVAFDLKGGRLGYGKGYYDRTLQGYDGFTIGVCFAAQVTDSISPEPHDVPMQFLANEQGVQSVTYK